MLKRVFGYLRTRDEPAPPATRELHERGFTALRSVLEDDEITELRREIDRVFEEFPPDRRVEARPLEEDEAFRYEMLNRSAACQRAIGHPVILETIEPLLGEDCHVIANTAWRNPAGQPGTHGGQVWHIDAGPHVPRPKGTRWPDEIPYPVFAVGVHILLQDSRLEDGPTGAIPGSHRSGRYPPLDALMDSDLECEGERCVPLLGAAGDVLLFVSDVWHRRMPTGEGDHGRFFLQAHYGRRDIAQRIRPTSAVNALSPEAAARADTPRERTLIGLHDPFFYDG